MNKPAAQWLRQSLLIVASILVGLMALEIGLRASTWGYLFTWPNFVLDARTVLAERDRGRYAHDERLGLSLIHISEPTRPY